MRLRAREIPEPEEGTRSVLVPTHGGPAREGEGSVTYYCERCAADLIRNVALGQIQGGLVVKCLCGAFCEIRPVDPKAN